MSMNNDQEIEFVERPDYSKRNRKLGWRRNCFHLHRSYGDDELRAVLRNALDLKRKKI